jgi:uncharacterized protein
MDGFEWDPIKAATNLRDHEVDFADAAVALSDLLAMTIEDPDAGGEERFITVSMDALGRILITVYTYVGVKIRIISSRKASPGERRTYEAQYA